MSLDPDAAITILAIIGILSVVLFALYLNIFGLKIKK